MKKLIAIDLDGTTLNGASAISDKTAAVLNKATQAGHLVTIATGRPYRMSQQFYQQLQLKTPMINFNGALVHLPGKKWSGESETLIDRTIVFDILAQKQALKLDFIAAENRETFFIDDLQYFDPKFFAGQATEKNLLSPKNLLANPTSLLLRTQTEAAAQVSSSLIQQFGSHIEVNTWGGPHAILEIVAKGIQKAHGLQHVAQYLAIDKKDIIAFGDEHNDVDMLEYAGWGVAMKNGTDQLKAVANDITIGTNDEDGLADYLQDYLAL